MNIFYLDSDPVIAAEQHCDKHVLKMVVETAQMCMTAYYTSATDLSTFPRERAYKPTHIDHPCTVWVGTCIENWRWAFKLGETLLGEYTRRFGKIHATTDVYEWMGVNNPKLKSLANPTPPPLAMDDKYKTSCPVESYRNYYNFDKARFAKWKNTSTPYWFKNLYE